MFERLRDIWKGVRGWMVNWLSIKSQVQVEMDISPQMSAAIDKWMAMYTGDAPWLTEDIRPGLNIPAFIAAEVARLATVEMHSGLSGGKRAAFLTPYYQAVIDDARVFTEYAAAGGSLALKPYVDGKDIVVDYVKAGMFSPTAFDSSGNVTGCLFLDRITRGRVVYTRVEHHEMVPEGCRIQNTAYRTEVGGDDLGRQVPLDTVAEWASLEADALIERVDRPLFAILKMPYANTVDPSSPIGVSAYARAVDLIEEADRQFARLLWEMESGNRAMYVDMRAFEADEAQPGVLPFKRFYRTMDMDPTTQTKLFDEWSPTYREQSQIRALNEILQRIEDACGLSRGTLSESPESNAGGAKTATELKIMRQRTFATIRDTQKAVEMALRQLLWAMDTWATIAGLAPIGPIDVSFEFDDSVVTDRSAEFMERQQLVAIGAMNAWELRAWYLGETEEQAKESLQQGQAGTSMFADEE